MLFSLNGFISWVWQMNLIKSRDLHFVHRLHCFISRDYNSVNADFELREQSGSLEASWKCVALGHIRVQLIKRVNEAGLAFSIWMHPKHSCFFIYFRLLLCLWGVIVISVNMATFNSCQMPCLDPSSVFVPHNAFTEFLFPQEKYKRKVKLDSTLSYCILSIIFSSMFVFTITTRNFYLNFFLFLRICDILKL